MADAESNCVTHHGNLASIHNQGEQSFISGLIHKKFQRNEYAWIGLYDAIQEGRWFWTDGSKVVFTYWSQGEPNNEHVEHCTLINWHG
ncbi:galactose-specific lectin nattectin-like, partial [Scomber scombrus]